jgi:hypothetical protein
MQWAQRGCLDDKPLLEACLRDQRHDMQLEESRGEWLWEMIQKVEAAERFRVPILHALYDLGEPRSANQLCELAGHYAGSGDETFRTRLYDIVEQKPIPDECRLGEAEIIELDGEQAFIFAARVRGSKLANRNWEWDDGALVDDAIERLGEGRVNELLATSTDRALNQFRRAWCQERKTQKRKTQSEQQRSRREKMQAIPVGKIISDTQSYSVGIFRGWGMYAEQSDLELVLKHLCKTEDPKVIAKLLRVFSNRTLPYFEAGLIELCRHRDADVRRAAFHALEKNAHPLVREFAVSEVAEGVTEHVIGLFVKNFQPGDEQLILEAIEFPDDEDKLHWLLTDVIEVLENNPQSDCSELAVLTYASTPCQNCRYRSATLLRGQNVAPAWLIEECRYDANDDCRKLMTESNASHES